MIPTRRRHVQGTLALLAALLLAPDAVKADEAPVILKCIITSGEVSEDTMRKSEIYKISGNSWGVFNPERQIWNDRCFSLGTLISGESDVSIKCVYAYDLFNVYARTRGYQAQLNIDRQSGIITATEDMWPIPGDDLSYHRRASGTCAPTTEPVLAPPPPQPKMKF